MPVLCHHDRRPGHAELARLEIFHRFVAARSARTRSLFAHFEDGGGWPVFTRRARRRTVHPPGRRRAVVQALIDRSGEERFRRRRRPPRPGSTRQRGIHLRQLVEHVADRSCSSSSLATLVGDRRLESRDSSNRPPRVARSAHSTRDVSVRESMGSSARPRRRAVRRREHGHQQDRTETGRRTRHIRPSWLRRPPARQFLG